MNSTPHPLNLVASAISQAAHSACDRAHDGRERQARPRKARAAIPEALADVALIDAGQCAAAAGIGLSGWYEMVASGEAPAAAVRQPRYTRWRLADVRAWLIERTATTAVGMSGEATVSRARKASAKAQELRRAKRVDLHQSADPTGG